MTLPNLITIGRLGLVPLVIMAIASGLWQLAFVLFVLAGLSDALDGFIARRFDMRSELGGFLDPLADKALIVSIYVTLALVGVVPVWLVVLIVSRDVMIVAGVILSWLLARPLQMAPFLVSKLNTAAQIGFAALVLGLRAAGIDGGHVVTAAELVVTILTLASLGAYLAFGMRHLAS
ncbi:CDP-alcohol phosphatidyltransferase family protein [Bosea sp. TWI1241]|jgi:cardiolipin synthase|uniref:CDP-alcohol phosphatidyltransferase family protein n=1 Tax=Bosea sp. TWI1241 TaxID=3148904 RepID=UPI0032081F45